MAKLMALDAEAKKAWSSSVNAPETIRFGGLIDVERAEVISGAY